MFIFNIKLFHVHLIFFDVIINQKHIIVKNVQIKLCSFKTYLITLSKCNICVGIVISQKLLLIRFLLIEVFFQIK